MVLARSSPATVSTPVVAENVAVTAGMIRPSSGSSASRGRGGFRTGASGRPLPQNHFETGLRSDINDLQDEEEPLGPQTTVEHGTEFLRARHRAVTKAWPVWLAGVFASRQQASGRSSSPTKPEQAVISTPSPTRSRSNRTPAASA